MLTRLHNKCFYGFLLEKDLAKKLIAPLVVCSVIFVLFNVLLGFAEFYVTDYVVCLLFSYALFWVSKDNLFYVVNVFFLILVLYAVNRVKLQYFGQPVMASDILSVIALYDVQSEMVKNVVLISLLVFGLGVSLNLRYSKKSVLTFVVVFIFLPVVYVSSLAGDACINDKATGCKVSEGLYGRSSIYSFALSLAELKAELVGEPDLAQVSSAMEDSVSGKWLFHYLGDEIHVKRNVHFILVESLWDPLTIKTARFAEDPFDVGFRGLWESAGYSLALSPVFGGGTANAEFELLCGMPVTTNVIRFELPVLNSSLPCLPDILRAQGYMSVASHPNIEGFWNRDAAYPKLGFEHYYSINDFDGDDMLSGLYLSDKSLYRQTTERLAASKRPLFNYVLTASEHYPYAESQDKEQREVTNIDNAYFSRYVRLVRRGTGELYQYYNYLRANDPEAVIVILGDHLPLFGRRFAVYKDSALFDGGPGDKPENLLRMHATPLIVVDGKNGVVDVGVKGIYELPSIIMRLLTERNIKMIGDERHAVISRYRPLPNKGMLYYQNEWLFCEQNSLAPNCQEPLHVLNSMTTILKDVSVGSQYALLPDKLM